MVVSRPTPSFVPLGLQCPGNLGRTRHWTRTKHHRNHFFRKSKLAMLHAQRWPGEGRKTEILAVSTTTDTCFQIQLGLPRLFEIVSTIRQFDRLDAGRWPASHALPI